MPEVPMPWTERHICIYIQQMSDSRLPFQLAYSTSAWQPISSFGQQAIQRTLLPTVLVTLASRHTTPPSVAQQTPQTTHAADALSLSLCHSLKHCDTHTHTHADTDRRITTTIPPVTMHTAFRRLPVQHQAPTCTPAGRAALSKHHLLEHSSSNHNADSPDSEPDGRQAASRHLSGKWQQPHKVACSHTALCLSTVPATPTVLLPCLQLWVIQLLSRP